MSISPNLTIIICGNQVSVSKCCQIVRQCTNILKCFWGVIFTGQRRIYTTKCNANRLPANCAKNLLQLVWNNMWNLELTLISMWMQLLPTWYQILHTILKYWFRTYKHVILKKTVKITKERKTHTCRTKVKKQSICANWKYFSQ